MCSNCQPGSLSKCTNGSSQNGSIPDANSNNDMSSNGDDLSNAPNDPIPAEDTSSRLFVTTDPVLSETTCPTAAENTPFLWGSLDGDEFKRKIEEIYEVVVCWKRNLFLIPSGHSGKAFVDEVARLFKCYAECDALESIALKACMVMQTLMLQKPRRQSKAKEHATTLHRHLSLRLNGDIDPLFVEGQSIQARLLSVHNSREDDNLVRRFTSLMSKGMIRAALRCFEDTTSHKVLNPSDIIQPPNQNAETVLDTLKRLHPPAQTTSPDAMLNAPTENPLPLNNCIFEAIYASLIKKVACLTQGAAGPSGVDAFAWKRMCTSFGSASNNLCHALASVAKRLCTTQVAPTRTVCPCCLPSHSPGQMSWNTSYCNWRSSEKDYSKGHHAGCEDRCYPGCWVFASVRWPGRRP